MACVSLLQEGENEPTKTMEEKEKERWLVVGGWLVGWTVGTGLLGTPAPALRAARCVLSPASTARSTIPHP
jgi:hypothetical protein